VIIPLPISNASSIHPAIWRGPQTTTRACWLVVPWMLQLQERLKCEDKSDKPIFWHTGEVEYENESKFGLVRYKIWERYFIPEWDDS